MSIYANSFRVEHSPLILAEKCVSHTRSISGSSLTDWREYRKLFRVTDKEKLSSNYRINMLKSYFRRSLNEKNKM